MPTYKETQILVRATEPIDALKLGTTHPVELRDASGRAILILHYEDQDAAEAVADALANISSGLVGLTAQPILPT